MSYIAGNLLLHMGDEYLAFQAFCNLMNRYILFAFYSFNMAEVNIFFNVYMRLLRQQLPKLAQLFEETGLSCSIYLFEWCVAVFSNILPLQVSSRVWDLWLYYGELFFMRVCLAISACLFD